MMVTIFMPSSVAIIVTVAVWAAVYSLYCCMGYNPSQGYCLSPGI